MLAPICQVSDGESAPYEPDGTFLVGKATPKDKKFIFEDMMCPITSKELYLFFKMYFQILLIIFGLVY